MNKKGLDLLYDLCEINAPSGIEYLVKDYIKQRLSGKSGDIFEDAIGNLYYFINGKSSDKSVMISAHMDEVGFMISGIDENGTLRFSNVGGIDTSVIAGRKVNIGIIAGVIVLTPVHLLNSSERDSVTPKDRMRIDIGAESRNDALKYVKVGDYATFSVPFAVFGNGRMLTAKALDDRLGCSVMIDVIDSLDNFIPDCDVCFAFTVREEIGASGALTAVKRIKPTFSLVLETTSAADLPSIPYTEQVAKTGEGPAVSFADRSTVYNYDFYRFVIESAHAHGVKAQPKRFTSGGNDASYVHTSGEGVITAALSAPTRYLHSASCVINTDDYFATVGTVKAVISDIGKFDTKPEE